MAEAKPQIDLICNVVVRRANGDVLLAQYVKDDERWWIPTRDLVPYEHPDEAAPKVIADLEGLSAKRVVFSEIESFRGRSGWHVMFNYLADVTGDARTRTPFKWFAPDKLPQMVHGSWEKQVIAKALEKARTDGG